MPNKDQCPCTNERPEQLPDGPEPARVVTMVHGTFARHAEWTRKGPLPEAMQDLSSSPEKTLLSRFCWSGRNSHAARLRAGRELADHLRGLTRRFGNARHFVVSHSHGGNVALYALRDPELAARVDGVVTMATPFLTVRRRKLHPLVLSSVLGLGFVGVLEAGLSAWGKWRPEPADLEGSWLVPLTVLFLVWFAATALSALIYLKQIGWRDLLRLLLRKNEDVEEIVGRQVTTLDPVSGLADAEAQLAKMLVVRPMGDEASMGLVVSQFLGWAQNRILNGLGASVRNFKTIKWYSWLWKLVFVFALAIVLLNRMPWIANAVSTLQEKETLGGFGPIVELVAWVFMLLIGGFFTIYVIFGLLSLIGLLVLLLAGLSFGPDAMFWNHYTSATAEASPPGAAARVFLQRPPQGATGLAHSGIYGDSAVIDEIVDWMRSRETV